MDSTNHTSSVDELIRNAELRTELEPYFDETLSLVNIQHWSLRRENDYLASMLSWEKAPALSIRDWFEPPLVPPHPSQMSDEVLAGALQQLIQKLYEKRIVLDFTDHLSDRDLYELIVFQILPTSEKKIDNADFYRHWDCSSAALDEEQREEIWLTYYASDEERDGWEDAHCVVLPPKQLPLYPRNLPKDTQF